MPSEKDIIARRLIPDLPLIKDPLPKEFARFERDDLYFIDFCHFSDFARGATFSLSLTVSKEVAFQQQMFPTRTSEWTAEAQSARDSDEARAERDREERIAKVDDMVPRTIALTPTALFVTDSLATLYRATKYENIKEVGYQIILKKKLFTTEKRLYICFKIENEPDCYVYIDPESAKDFIQIFAKIMSVRRPKDFALREVPESQPIKEYVSVDIPKGFLTAQEINTLNVNRKDITEHVNSILQEVTALTTELETLRPETQAARTTLKTMEGATTDDLTQLRRKRQELHEAHTSLQRSCATMQLENEKIYQAITRAEEQLAEDKNNYDKLVKDSVSAADNAALREQNNMTLLRQKAQKREADRQNEKLEQLLQVLYGTSARPVTYSGHEVFAEKARTMEAKIKDLYDKWGREMETANKLEKFIDNLGQEVERIDEQLDVQHQKKMELIEEIENRLGIAQPKKKEEEKDQKGGKKKTATATAPGGGNNDSFGDDLDIEDDDLIGGGSASSPPTAGGELEGRARGNTTVVVGGAVASANDSNGGDLDDDLLGDGGGGAAAKPPTASAPQDDDFGDVDDI